MTLSLDVGDTGMALGDGEGATGVPVDDVTFELDADDITTGCEVTEAGGGEVITPSDGSGSDVIGGMFNGRAM